MSRKDIVSPSELGRFFGVLLLSCSFLNNDNFLPWLNFYGEAMACAGIAFLSLSCLLRSRSPGGSPAPYLCLFFVLTMVALQWCFGILKFAGDFFLAVLYVISIGLAVYCGQEISKSTDSEKQISFIALGILIAALLSAFIGYFQVFDLTNLLPFAAGLTAQGDNMIKPSGNLSQSNNYATLLIIGFFTLHVWNRRAKFSLTTKLLISLTIAGAVVFAQSRAAVLSTVAATIYLWGMSFYVTKKTPSFSDTAVVFCFAATIVLGYVFINGISSLLLYESDPRVTFAQLNGRLETWRQLGAALLESPWFGYGWNQTREAQFAGAATISGSGPVSHAHSIFIDFLAWFGLPVGALMVLVGSGYFVYTGITQKSLTGVFCFACVIPVAVQSLVEFPFAYAQFLIVSFVFFGFCVGSNDGCIRQHRFFGIWRKSLHLKFFASNRLVTCVLFVYSSLGGVVFYDYVRAEKSFSEVRFDFLKFHRVDTPTFIPPQFYTLTQLDALMRAWSIQPDPKMSRQSIELLASVSAHYNFASIHYRYLLALALSGDTLSAMREAKRLRHIYGSRFYAGVLADFEEKKSIYLGLSAFNLPK